MNKSVKWTKDEKKSFVSGNDTFFPFCLDTWHQITFRKYFCLKLFFSKFFSFLNLQRMYISVKGFILFPLYGLLLCYIRSLPFRHHCGNGNTVKPEPTTTFRVCSIKVPLNNGHLSTTANILGFRYGSLSTVWL